MKKLAYYALSVAALVLLVSACSWSAVNIDWSGGAVDLQLVANPDAQNESWLPQVWYGELPITMTDLGQVSFTGTGNFKAATGADVLFVRLKQVVVNNTNYTWTDFHIRIDGGYFYKKWLLQNGWNVVQNDTAFDFYANSGYGIAPGQTFVDGIEFSIPASSDGNVAFTLTKWPTVPEPGSAIAIMTGLIGLLSIARRRKA